MNAMQSFRSRAISATFLLVPSQFSPAIKMSMSLSSGSPNAVDQSALLPAYQFVAFAALLRKVDATHPVTPPVPPS